jgi:hypothetical protein
MQFWQNLEEQCARVLVIYQEWQLNKTMYAA